MQDVKRLKETVIDGNFCIGCGACAAFTDQKITITKNDHGFYEADVPDDLTDKGADVNAVCPFSDSLNEDRLGEMLYKSDENTAHDPHTGYYLKNYAGHVKEDDYRRLGTSGGFVTWIAAKLLEEDEIDAVLHVKEDKDSDKLFSYQVSDTVEAIKEGAASKYYPVEMSDVLSHVKNNEGRYLVIGVPCFIRAVRLLQESVPVFKERIVYTAGLICGALASDFFTKAAAMEMGVEPTAIERVDYRLPAEDEPAYRYRMRIKGRKAGEEVTLEAMNDDLYVGDWGLGLFKYKACDYCDDVMSETADITLGDAWMEGYQDDNKGANLITIRHPALLELIARHEDKLSLQEVSTDTIAEAQAAAFRHRRTGLSYRLYLALKDKRWHPPKRVRPRDDLPEFRKRIYEQRSLIRRLSPPAFKKALERDDFNHFKETMNEAVKAYYGFYQKV